MVLVTLTDGRNECDLELDANFSLGSLVATACEALEAEAERTQELLYGLQLLS